MFHKSMTFKKLAGDITKTYSYKGLHFPLHEQSLIAIGNEIEAGGKVTTQPLYAFYGRLLLNKTQIRERVDLMVKNGLHTHTTVSAAIA